MADAPDVYIAGERVALGALRVDLAATYSRWLAAPASSTGGGGAGWGARGAALAATYRRGWAAPGGGLGLPVSGLPAALAETEGVQDATRRSAAEPPGSAHFTVYDRRDMAPVG